MKIAGNTPPLNFQKILRANCFTLKNNRPQKCSIYELEPDCDYAYFFDIKKDAKREKMSFYSCFSSALDYYSDNIVYVLEDKKNRFLGGAITSETHDGKILSLEYIEKNLPDKNKKNEYKYIGEAILTFLALKVEKEKREVLVVPSVIPSCHDFYEKCCLKDIDKFLGMAALYLKNKDCNKLLMQNCEHTKHKMEIIV